MAAPLAANATPPAAGQTIGNQAAAQYTDANNVTQNATSNQVVTVVQQVGALSLTASNTKSGAPGNTVYMPHTLTNSGNGSDTFTLSMANNAGTFDFSSYQIFLDADGNGLPDNATPLASGTGTYTTPALPAGGTFKFVVALTVPGSASNGQTDNVTVTATAGTAALYPAGATTATNTDTVNALTAVPIFSVTKAISQSSGVASASSSCTGTNYAGAGCVKVTYTLTYTNNGTATGPLYLKDVIGSGATAGMEYIAGSAKWNTANALTDAAGGDPSGIDFQAISGSVEAVVASVAPGVTGTLSFDVGIKSTAAVGTSTTNNTGSFEKATASTVATGTPASTQTTNPSAYTVSAGYGVVFNNGANTAGVPADGNNTTASGNDAVTVATAAAGSTVTFSTNTVWNTGNSADTFNISYGASSFPAGTTFALFKSDGVTPLTDSNGDGTVDTGPVAAGGSYVVVVKATIPGTACASGCPAAPLTVTLTATSIGDPTKSNKVFDSVTTSLTGPSVTLGNGTVAPGTVWAGGAPVTTVAVSGGATASFDLIVNNTATGGPAETYTLDYSASNFTAGTVPSAGWTVVFRAGACSANGSVITSIGPVAAGGSAQYCAVVTTTSGTAAGLKNVYFRVTSGATGASAVKLDAVTINTLASLTIAPSNSGQVQAGGSVVYAHTITNTGNVSCPSVSWTINQSLAAQGWTATTYLDNNGDGQVDAGDTVATSLSAALAPGASQKLVVKVFAPGGATAGATDVLTIQASDATCGTGSATDTSTVFSGQLRLNKTQALDADCDGTPETAFSATQITAKPGACVVYQVVATNQGATAVTNVSISDATPTYTTLKTAGVCSAGTASSPSVGSTGTVACNGIGSIAAGATATLTFGVQITP